MSIRRRHRCEHHGQCAIGESGSEDRYRRVDLLQALRLGGAEAGCVVHVDVRTDESACQISGVERSSFHASTSPAIVSVLFLVQAHAVAPGRALLLP